MSDLGFTAATMALHRAGDPSRYDGWVGLSALPTAPVVPERPRKRRLARAVARVTRRQARLQRLRTADALSWCDVRPSATALGA